jgi:hypothetical protein
MHVTALDGLVQIGPLTELLDVDVIERDLAVGAWMVRVPLGGVGSVGQRMLSATWPGIEVYDPGTGWRFGGYLAAATVTQRDDGTSDLTLLGRDMMGELQSRLDWPNVEDAGEWWANVIGGTIPITSDAHNMIGTNAGTGAITSRRIAGLVHAPNPNAGPTKGRRLKGLPLLDVLREMFTGEDWTARLRLVRSPATGAPAIEFSTPSRQLAQIVLDARTGTVGAIETTVSAASATWVLAMGAETETPSVRMVEVSAVPATSWRTRRVEVALNRPSTDNGPALVDEARGVRRAGAPSTSIKVDGARVEGFGRLIDIGWTVDVRTGSGLAAATVRLPVVASRLTLDPRNGWVRTVDVGSESLSGPASVLSRLAELGRMMRKIESELQ